MNQEPKQSPNTDHITNIEGNRRPPVENAAPAGVVAGRRELFWHNVIREILNSLAGAAAAAGGRLTPTASGAAQSGSPASELFDGRMAVVTRFGQRIPIADIYPVFACSVPTAGPSSAETRMLSMDVQCTVFQIRTPAGEVYTLPVHEISAIHALSEHLIQRLAEQARQAAGAGSTPQQGDETPFGFAAFTSLAQSEQSTGG